MLTRLRLGSLSGPHPLACALGYAALLDELPERVERLLGELVPPAEPILVGAYLAGQATDFVAHLAGELEQWARRLEDRRGPLLRCPVAGVGGGEAQDADLKRVSLATESPLVLARVVLPHAPGGLVALQE